MHSSASGLYNSRCRLRVIYQSDYTVSGGSGHFDASSHAVIYPTCMLWVPGISPADACEPPGSFSGCVITSTTASDSTHLSTGTSYFDGYYQASSLFVPRTSSQ